MVGLVLKKRMALQCFPLGPVVSNKGADVLETNYEDFS